MAIFGTLENVILQTQCGPALESAFAHLRLCLSTGTPENQRLMAMRPGEKDRTELAHGAFALAACSITKPAGEGRWESHVAYLDVQAVISGREIMEVTDIGGLTLLEDMTPEKDLLFYQAPESCSRLMVEAGMAAVFYPSDGHRPSQSAHEPAPVCKVVVKVPV